MFAATAEQLAPHHRYRQHPDQRLPYSHQSIPLFVPLVERVWLGEPIPPRLWRVLLIGFAGLLLGLGLTVLPVQPGALLFHGFVAHLPGSHEGQPLECRSLSV